MSDDKAHVEIDTVEETVNYKDGFSFDFEDASNKISVHCSSVSGKESIFFNGDLIASKRSFRRKSSMNFNIGKDAYEVEFHVIDMLKGETHCTLIKNDVHVKTIKKALLLKNQLTCKNAWLKIFAYFVLGAIFGFVSVRYLLAMYGG
jgi:hypothetical protein